MPAPAYYHGRPARFWIAITPGSARVTAASQAAEAPSASKRPAAAAARHTPGRVTAAKLTETVNKFCGPTTSGRSRPLGEAAATSNVRPVRLRLEPCAGPTSVQLLASDEVLDVIQAVECPAVYVGAVTLGSACQGLGKSDRLVA